MPPNLILPVTILRLCIPTPRNCIPNRNYFPAGKHSLQTFGNISKMLPPFKIISQLRISQVYIMQQWNGSKNQYYTG